jgi:hypothetical protein
MKITVVRTDFEEKFIRGLWYFDDDAEPFCYTCEDIERPVKIKHETAIPYGSYEIKFKNALTGMTIKYQSKYEDFFSFHLELQNVRNYTSVYIHVGNSQRDTSGCILVGYGKGGSRYPITNSTKAFRDMYIKVSAALHRGEVVTLDIIK